MANMKKPEAVAIQTDITLEKDWAAALKKQGILVVDVYQGWCGPCIAMQSVLKKLKLDLGELGETLLHFAVANADKLNTLDKYRGNCEPTWLFYAQGEFLGVLQGTNAPLMTALIKELLAIEQQYLNGQLSERKTISGVIEYLQGITDAQSSPAS